MLYSKAYFGEILHNLEEQLAISQKELADCPQGSLHQDVRDGHTYFLHAEKKSDGRISRKIVNGNPEILQGLMRGNYLKCEIAALDQDVRLLKYLQEHFREYTPQELLQKLPKRLKPLPQEFFLPQTENMQEEIPWENQPYEQSDYKPEARVHRSSRGLLLRSKSELSIAELFYVYDVPFRYEQVLHVGQYRLSTDFTLKNRRTGKLYYWEHCGLVNNEKYMSRHKWKLDLYEKIGIVPWDNLIVTYDGPDGNMDLAIAESEIKNKLL